MTYPIDINSLFRRSKRALVTSVGVSAITLATSQHAFGAGKQEAPDIAVAERLYLELDYEGANKEADRLVRQSGISHDQLVRGYRVLGITYATLNQEKAARDAFVLLLTYAPEYPLDPNLGPKVQAPFQEARGFWRAQQSRPGIEVASDVRARAGGFLRVTTRDPTHVTTRVVVGYRWGSRGAFTTTTAAVGDGVPVEVSPAPAGVARLDYFAQGVDAREVAAFELGNPTLPKSTLVATGAPEAVTVAASTPARVDSTGGHSVFASPLFWTAAAVVVAGGAVGGYVLFRPDDPSTMASATPRLVCGQAVCR